jgi:23S rRNA G2445 N2-methylase RlmL
MAVLNNELIVKFKDGAAGREDLAAIVKEIKDGAVTVSLKSDEDFRSAFCGYLKNDDAKIRKNAAKIAAELMDDGLSDALFEAYAGEDTLYVRPELLKALIACGAEKYRDRLSERLKELKAAEVTKEDEKHIAPEIRALQEYLGHGKHTFTGFSGPCELLLTTLPGTEEVLLGAVAGFSPRAVSGGVRVSVGKLRDILEVRPFDEMLFLIPGYSAVKAEPDDIADAIGKSGLLMFLDRRHKEQDRPYRFRVELKLSEGRDETAFVKKISRALEFSTGHRLVNSVDDYEAELRITERKDGKASCLLKLFTLKDDRFAYRTEVIAKGLKPCIAASAVACAKDFLRPDAQVLDPFCGAGTLLIERAKACGARNLYGIDIFGEAVEAARKNTANAGFRANYINRDFFDFRHDYLFEEVITELPSETKDEKDGEKELLKLYRRFLEKIAEHLSNDGFMLVMTRKTDIFEKAVGTSVFKIEKRTGAGKSLGIYVLKMK